MSIKKADKLKALYDSYIDQFSNQEIVLGNGNIDTKLLLIGEAPGRDEVSQGKPFVGAAGKNLTEFLNMLKIERNMIYITNAIKYRLSTINPKTGQKINRPAQKEEIEKNRKYLMEEISIINPKLIVTLGNVPLKAVVGGETNGISIGQVHGRLGKAFVRGEEKLLFPLYHPASIIYKPELRTVYMEDLLKLSKLNIFKEENK